MDPRKRDLEREEARKASLRKDSHVLYAPVTSTTANTPDLRIHQPLHHGNSAAQDDAAATHAPSPRLSLNTHASRAHPTSKRLSWQSPAPMTAPLDGQFSRDPSPMSPGRGMSRSGLAPPRDYSPFSQSRSPSTSRRPSVKNRGAISVHEEGEYEEAGEELAVEPRRRSSRRPSNFARKRREPWHVRLQAQIEHGFTRAKNIVLRRGDNLVSGLGREISVVPLRSTPPNDPRTNAPYIPNFIRSSKYTYWSFFPRQLFFQFSKFANIYFLCIAILQMIPGLSTTGTYTTIIPLLIFIFISMAKEGFEDYRRHKLDKAENTSKATRTKGNLREQVEWQNLAVGDVIEIRRDENIPADVVILNVHGTEDRAYVETMALDGETNLKNKGAPAILQKMELSPEQLLARNDLSVHVEDPNLDLYNFSGNITIASEKQPLTNDQVIYRGSILRNTNSILGLIIYTGEECKIRMNATKRPRIKAPRMQAQVNKVVLFIAALVVFLSLMLSVAYLITAPKERKAFYIANAQVQIVPIFVSFIIMLNTMIPLSLYVSMEIIKLIQIGLMMGDMEMYDPVTNTPMEARTSTINEELGQVSYVFSDKTGTLTDNIMKFRMLSVAGTAWLHRPDAEEEDFTEFPVQGQDYKRVERGSTEGTPLMGKTEDLIRQMMAAPETQFARTATFFILSIALCHTCVSERGENGFEYSATSPDEVALVQAAQEMGFIFVDSKAGLATLRVPLPNGDTLEENYQILEVLEFSSKRKRMSLLVRMPDNRVCLFSKGADSTIKELLAQTTLTKEAGAKVERKATLRKSIEAQDYMRRKSVQQARHSFARGSRHFARQSLVDDARAPPMSPSSPMKVDFSKQTNSMDFAQKRKSWHGDSMHVVESPTALSPVSVHHHFAAPQGLDDVLESDTKKDSSPEADVFDKCFQHIDYFATDGLRTLLYGYRYVEENEYQQWSRINHEASTALTDRAKQMDTAAEIIERDLQLAGATAIEDKLQDGVPLAIDRLRRAGIKVWVLTGDKRETAINIGKSCQLIKDFSSVAVLDHTQGDIFLQIQSALTQMRNAVHSVVVVDGATLAQIEDDEPLFDFFHALAVFVDSVLCCRASPAQKASLVKSIRLRVPKSVTLAIGDGSNDVAMIQEAHVGIGIAGREGLQAARTSDYSIAQFRFLARLLLVHGRYNYIRVCKYTLGTFWKEMMFFLTQAMFQQYNGYTGTSLYESWSLSMFNTLFTSLPVIALGAIEKDLSPETLLAVPELYNFGQRSRGFTLYLYLGWSIMAAGSSALVFYLPMTLYGQAPYVKDSQLFAFGSLCFTAAVVVICFKLQFFEIHYKTWISGAVLLIEVGGWFLWNLILAGVYNPKENPTYKVKGAFTKHFGKDGLWWLTAVLTTALCFTFEVAVTMARQIFRPSDVDVYQKLEKDKAMWGSIFKIAHAGDNEHGSIPQIRPPERTKTQQMRRDAEYESLITRTRTNTSAGETSVEGIRKAPGKLVRFLTRDNDAKTLGAPTPALSQGQFTPAGGLTPAGGVMPSATWNRAGTTAQDIEMSNMITFTPIDYRGRAEEPGDYFAARPDTGVELGASAAAHAHEPSDQDETRVENGKRKTEATR